MSDIESSLLDRSTTATRFISSATSWFGSFVVIALAVVIVLVWLIGVIFVPHHFENQNYQLVINTISSILTFIMVFVIQNTQNRDGRAMQAKLDAQSEALYSIASHLGIENQAKSLTKTVGLEDAPEHDIRDEHDRLRQAVHTTITGQ